MAISADCLSIETITAHEFPSRPFFPSSYPISSAVFLTIAGISSCAFVVISPVTRMKPVQLAVSHATRLIGSCCMHASSIASDTASQSLSGCPSVTDSDVNNNFSINYLLLLSYYVTNIFPIKKPLTLNKWIKIKIIKILLLFDYSLRLAPSCFLTGLP